MKDHCYRIPLYELYEGPAITRWLERMAAKGWLLESIGCWWRFAAIPPKKLRFAVCFCPESSVMDPEPRPEARQYEALCEAAGWKLAAQRAQMQIYYTDAPDAVPVETDEACRLQSIRRTLRKTWVLSNTILMAVCLLYGVLLAAAVRRSPVKVLSDGMFFYTALLLAVIALVLLAQMVTYGIWVARSVRLVRRGGLCARGGLIPGRVCVAVMLGGILLCGVAMAVTVPSQRHILLVGLFRGAAVLAIGAGLRAASKRLGLEGGLAWGFVLVGAFIVILPLLWVENWLADRLAPPPENQEQLTVEVDGESWEYTVTHDPLPLTIQQLDPAAAAWEYETEYQINASPLLVWEEGSQSPCYGGGEQGPILWYDRMQVRFAPIYELCQQYFLELRWVGGYVSVDPAPWGAQAVYAQQEPAGANEGVWLVCYEDQILWISYSGWAGTEPDAAQIAAVRSALALG